MRVEEAQRRGARSKVAAGSARRAGRSGQVVDSDGKLFQLIDTTAQLVRQGQQVSGRFGCCDRFGCGRCDVKELLNQFNSIQNVNQHF